MNRDWAAVTGGWPFSLLIKTNGDLYSCGYNADGQPGLGDSTNRNVPTLVGPSYRVPAK